MISRINFSVYLYYFLYLLRLIIGKVSSDSLLQFVLLVQQCNRFKEILLGFLGLISFDFYSWNRIKFIVHCNNDRRTIKRKNMNLILEKIKNRNEIHKNAFIENSSREALQLSFKIVFYIIDNFTFYIFISDARLIFFILQT